MGGEGVFKGAVDGAVVTEDVEGILSDLAGVEKPEIREPRDKSGCVLVDESPLLWFAKDIAENWRPKKYQGRK